MCRLPLTYIFPSYFASSSSKQGSSAGSYNIRSAPRTHRSSAFIHAGTGRNDWLPYQGRGEKTGIHLTSVQAKHKAGDDTSEEYILPTATDAGRARATSEEAEEEEDRRAIRKTMAFHMTYDDNGAKA
ncbi:hypothetical protein CTA2_8553 [Colletotrichum tanaceti]|nr:hypothetical protein CTA2_8553 [Colletotrichum tanaceti]